MKKILKRFKIGLKQSWYKQNFIVIVIGLILLSSLSIGYSILSQNLNIIGDIILRAEKDIRVTKVISNITDCGFDIYNPKFNEDSITVNLELPALECTIEYNVTVSNNGTKAMELISIIKENYNNNDIIYEINGYSIGDVLLPSNSITFTITFRYNPSLIVLPNNTELGATIKFVWSQYLNNDEDDDLEPEIFVYTGSCKQYTVQQTGFYILETWGADGGAVTTSTHNSKGGYSKGIVKLTAGEILHVCVGGKGEANGTPSYINKGGWNGGGDAKNSSGSDTVRTGGGGATDIRVISNSLYNRIIVAGGGGGNSSHSNNMIAGNGGGETGANGGFGKGGSQTSGGSGQLQEGILSTFGIGGSQIENTVGGGGGGWYGGGNGNGAGGGSGYVLTPTSTRPSGYFANYTSYYLLDTVNTQYNGSGYVINPDSGGNGYAVITLINVKLKINGDSEIHLNVGDPYVEYGATLRINGAIQSGSNITTSGSVNTSIAGTYTITYSYTDSITGAIYYATRKVVVSEIIDYDVEFAYNGNVQTLIAPYTGQYKLEVWGAQGGGSTGGKGGYSTGIVTLQKGDILYVYVGGQGILSTSGGGFNGGGNPTNPSYYGGGGGTDIRIGTDSLYSRIIVAGGGGGQRDSYAPGYGGGEIGGNSVVSNIVAIGGSQTAGGASQQGGNWANYVTNGSFGLGGSWVTSAGTLNGFSGGGGGWYGGGAGHGGGGGSGYVYTSSTVANYPAGGLLNSDFYLENAYTVGGNTSFKSPTNSDETGHSGNGFAKVTLIKTTIPVDPDPDPEPDPEPDPDVNYEFAYTGSVQSVTLNPGTYKLETWGAQGGTSLNSTTQLNYGGYSTGIITLTETTTLYVYVGGRGNNGQRAKNTAAQGGWNGGGGIVATSGTSDSHSGGGATDISTVYSDVTLDSYQIYVRSVASYNSRLIVAGGGGGPSYGLSWSSTTAADVGNFGGSNGTRAGTANAAGTISSASTSSIGGFGYGSSSITTTGDDRSAGGGGWYGGGTNGDSYGGGGSNYVLTFGSYRPSGYLFSAGHKYEMTNASMASGNESMPTYDGTNTMTGNRGDGYAKITSIK